MKTNEDITLTIYQLCSAMVAIVGVDKMNQVLEFAKQSSDQSKKHEVFKEETESLDDPYGVSVEYSSSSTRDLGDPYFLDKKLKGKSDE